MSEAVSGEEVPPPRRFSGRHGASQASEALIQKRAPKTAMRQQIPFDILNNDELNDAISLLPANYNFEIHKTLWRVQQLEAKTVVLQFPEGLLMYSCVISDILERFGNISDCFILGDVTYGACCVDDFAGKALAADLLVHYGHSCLVPVTLTQVPCLYVFVTIDFDVQHLVDTVRSNFAQGTELALAGTVQFSKAVQVAREKLQGDFPSVTVPQSRPLSQGEVLGCTAPAVKKGTGAIVFIADGRFHLEAIMIANPTVPAFRYDPYAKQLLSEEYNHAGMQAQRRSAILQASSATRWGVILGTLGRQGNPQILETIVGLLKRRQRECTLFLMSEVMPWRLKKIGGIEAWVQIACPRLSIDWGGEFDKPTLTPYEAMVAMGAVDPWWEAAPGAAADGDSESVLPYPMDYYSREGGDWSSSYHKKNRAKGGGLHKT